MRQVKLSVIREAHKTRSRGESERKKEIELFYPQIFRFFLFLYFSTWKKQHKSNSRVSIFLWNLYMYNFFLGNFLLSFSLALSLLYGKRRRAKINSWNETNKSKKNMKNFVYYIYIILLSFFFFSRLSINYIIFLFFLMFIFDENF